MAGLEGCTCKMCALGAFIVQEVQTPPCAGRGTRGPTYIVVYTGQCTTLLRMNDEYAYANGGQGLLISFLLSLTPLPAKENL